MRLTLEHCPPTDKPTRANGPSQITLYCRLLHRGDGEHYPDQAFSHDHAAGATVLKLIYRRCSGWDEASCGVLIGFSSPDAAGRPECRADRPPSTPADPRVPAKRAVAEPD